MKRLNEKGMTTVEILVCFVLISIISVSMYTTISTYNNKENIEAVKEKIYTYKNTLTKIIQDDLIKKGLTNATINSQSIFSDSDGRGMQYTINMSFKDGSSKELKITRYLASSKMSEEEKDIFNDSNKDNNDKFMITYDGIEYPLPNVGSAKNIYDKTVYDLRLNNVYLNNSKGVLSIYIGFYHPELGKRYAIDIVCPINAF